VSFLKTVESYRQGARTLPGRYYNGSGGVRCRAGANLRTSLDLCRSRYGRWRRRATTSLPWLPAKASSCCAISQGERRAVLQTSAAIRGTRLCEAPKGRLSETIQCPYHAWTYALDGRLIGAPHMHEVEGFDKKSYPLHTVALAEWNGFLFVNLDPAAVPAAQWFGPLKDRFAGYSLPLLRTVRRIEYDVKANWKLVLQNYNECLHCPTIHPELSTKLPYTSGAKRLDRRTVSLGGYMEIKAPNESATMTGRACALPLGTLAAEDQRRGVLLRAVSDDDVEPASGLCGLLHGVAGRPHAIARGL